MASVGLDVGRGRSPSPLQPPLLHEGDSEKQPAADLR